jgi:hypothetical protein
MLEELRIPLEKLEEALAKDKPAAYDADEEVADRMAGHGAAFQQQRGRPEKYACPGRLCRCFFRIL